MNGIDPINPKKFQYFLNIEGIDNEILFNSPDGWLETAIKYSRSKSFSGVVRQLTLPIKFVFMGAQLLRDEFYTYGLLANVDFIITKLIPKTGQYQQIFLGKIDFSQVIDEQNSFTVNAIEKNFLIQLDAYADTKYSIPLNDENSVDVMLTPLTLKESADFVVAGIFDEFHDNQFPQLIIADNQQNAVSASVQDVPYGQLANPDFSTLGNWFFTAQVDTKVNVNIKDLVFSIKGTGDSGVHILRFYNQNGVIVKSFYVSANIPFPAIVGPITFNTSFVINVAKGDKLFFYCVNNGVLGGGFQFQSGSISLDYNTQTPPSHCLGMRGINLFNSLVKQMNGPENPIVATQSTLLTGLLNNIVFTCSNSILTTQIDTLYQAGDNLQIGAKYVVLGGDITYVDEGGNTYLYHVNDTFTALLGFDTFSTTSDADGFVRQISSAPNIIISFNDFFQTIYSVMGGQAGVGMDQGVFCLEDLSFFYRLGLVALDLGMRVGTNSFKLTPNLDVVFNTIKVGYNDQQYDALNGGQEVCSTQEYSTKITTPKAELNLISPVRADPYGIENLRIIPGQENVAQGSTKGNYINSSASRSDNDVFMIWLKDAPEFGHTYYQPLRTEGLISITGVDPSYYNWKLTPKQNLLRGGRYLASCLDRMQGYQIVLTYGAKNISLVTVDSTGRRVAESEPIQISSLPPAIFKPYYLEIQAGLEINVQNIIDSKPYGEIRFLGPNNVQLKGFIDTIAIDAGQNSPQTFKIRTTPDLDLTKLKR